MAPMKRYLLFYGETYYPAGGWGDFRGSFDTLREATDAFGAPADNYWAHVVDTVTNDVWAQPDSLQAPRPCAEDKP